MGPACLRRPAALQLLLAVCAFAGFAAPAPAADISAGTMAAVSDLLSSATPDRPPAGTDPDTWRKALAALKQEGLAGAARPAQPGNTALLQAYANALLLGPRAREFRDQVGAVHDAVLGGDAAAIGNAIRDLYVAAGRTTPPDTALAGLVGAARDVGGNAPSETINHAIDRPGYHIEIVDAPAARTTAVAVIVKDGPGGKPARVLFDGTTRTGAGSGGDGLDRRTEPAPPCTMDERTAMDLRDKLNGEWQREGGETITIGGSGTTMTLTGKNRNGRTMKYAGSYRLGKVDLRHAITHPDDIGIELPEALRAELARRGLYFTLRLETCRNPSRLSGRWGSQHVTYNNFMQIQRVHDPYDQSYIVSRRVKSPDYRIATLRISYDKWETAQSELKAKQAIAADELKRAEERLRQENAAYEERRQRTGIAHRAFIAAEQAFNAAGQAIVAYVPPDAAKSDAYRKLERQRVKLARRVDMLYEGIIATVGGGDEVEPAAFDNYKRLQAEFDGVDAELLRLGGELGFAAERERLRSAAATAFVEMVRTESELNGAVGVQDQARAREDEAQVAYSAAQGKLSVVEQELARFHANAPRVSGVTAEDGVIMKYETVYWDPGEVLDYLNGEIPKLERVLERAAVARRDTRREFLDRQAVASALQDELADAIFDSALYQASVEMAFNLADMVEKGIEGGPIAAIGEGGKKIVEAVILGPPSFYEPALAPGVLTGDGGPFADIRKNINDSLKYAAKRGFKTAVTGPRASLLVKKYIESRSTQTYMQLIDQAVEGSMQTGYRIVGETQATRAVEAFDAMQEAREKFQKALKDGLFPRYAEVAGKSLRETLKKAAQDPRMRKIGASIMKDVVKGELKEQVGELIEGRAMRAYVAAEGEARIATQIFLAASNVYWESFDPYHERVSHRREILRQYDPNNHMQVRKDESFRDGAEILVVLRDREGRPLPASNHAITVTLGGKPPKDQAKDEFFFVFDATDLEHDGIGGVVLEISVAR